MEPEFLYGFLMQSCKCNVIDLIAAKTPLKGHVATWLLLLQFINMSTFFDLPIGFPDFPFGAFCIGPVTNGKRDFVGFKVSNAVHMDECNACIGVATEICAYLLSESPLKFFQLTVLV